MKGSWFCSVEATQEDFLTCIVEGISEEEVISRRKQYGENCLPKENKTSLLDLIKEQFSETLVRILLLAAIISAILGIADHNINIADAIIEPCVILLVLILNAYISIRQTKNAEDAIEALKEYEPELAKVKRAEESEVKWIKASELVPGDIVYVSVGDRIPADVRLCKLLSTSLKVDQSILTGESVSVAKYIEEIPYRENVVNQDKINILFSGSNVVSGKAIGIVVGTGANTEIGHIWHQLNMTENIRTPLQIKLDEFGNYLSKAISLICILVWAININHFCDPIHGGSWVRGAVYYFKIAVALAVAAIPEGLPAVITTCLAIGTKKMAKKNAIVRSLPSVETLGCTSVICSDKTGTLTTNKMSIIRAFTVSDKVENGFDSFTATGTTYNPADGHVFDSNMEKPTLATYPVLADLTHVSILCNDSSLFYNKDKRIVERVGEATEAALHTFAEKLDLSGEFQLSDSKDVYINIENAKGMYEKLHTLEFSRDRKSMSVYCRDIATGQCKMFVKGAPEMVLARCKYVRIGKETVELTKTLSEAILREAFALATGSDTLRCLALAVIDTPHSVESLDLSDPLNFINYEIDMTFIGVVGMVDPPREQVKKAIADCKSAGIRVIMITGDNKATAVSIARKIGIFQEGEDITGMAFSAAEFDSLSDDEQKKCCKVARLFARVEPAHKSKIVNNLQFYKEVTAMTGDGVNDAPALKKAEIGIAMGSGTAVAKSASDLVLADDDFSTIIVAIKEGRSIYRNTVQFISYLVSSNIGEVISIFLTSLLGLPEGLIPVQLLWVNLITDGLPATALGFNPPEPDIMKKHPRKHDDPIINTWQLARYTIIGTYVGIATVIANVWWYLYDSQGPHLTLKHLMNHQQCSAINPFYRNIDCELFNNYYPMTMALTVLVCSEMFNAYNSVSELQSIFTVPPWKNKFLMYATSLSMLIHVATTYLPFTQRIFQVTSLTFDQWTVVLLLSVPIIFLDEIMKFIYRRLEKD